MNLPENITRLCGRKPFSFACHPGVTCFTECCRELELVLTPYDVLALRRELRLSSAEFIRRYVVVEEDEQHGYPVLYLGMVDDGRASCPFVSDRGCVVYNSRPGSCRAYPVGRGVSRDDEGNIREIHVLVREEHCQGFAEPDAHTVAQWFENQGLTAYNENNDEVFSLLLHDNFRRGLRLTTEQREDFMLALYKLDEFRHRLVSPPLQDRYQISEAERQAVMADDPALLRFGIRWLKKNLCAPSS